LLLLLNFFHLFKLFAVGLVALVVQSRLLNEFDQVGECSGELVFLLHAVLQKFEMCKQLFGVVFVEKLLFEA